MRHLIIVPLLLLSLGGCHWFKSKPADDLAEMPSAEKRSIATSEEGRQLYSQHDQDILAGKCSNEVQHKIKLYRAERSWSKAPPRTDGSSTYLSPTSTLGRWVGVRKFQSGELQFMVLTKGNMEVYSFSATCSATKDTRDRGFSQGESREDTGPEFTDQDLESLIVRSKSYGIIYVWSPGMGYSFTRSINPDGTFRHADDAGTAVSGVKNAENAMLEVGKRLGVGMGMTVLVDPFSSRRSIQRAFERQDHDLTDAMLKRMTSFDLQMRAMGQHYPSLLVYGNGKIFRQMRPGLGTVESYSKFIEDAVKALQQ